MHRLPRLVLAVVVVVALFVTAVSPALADSGPVVVPLNGSGDFGDLDGFDLNRAVVGMAADPTGDGYWLVASDGGVFAFGGAGFHGSAGAIALVEPVVGMAATPTGDGYWLVASDGGIFTYGNAQFHGSAGAIALVEPVVGMAATPTGDGYWLVASDGGVFTYGAARFHGSAGAIDLASPIVAMASTPSGLGYWLLAGDGGVFAFGDAEFHGAAQDAARIQDALSMGASSGGGYWALTGDGKIHSFGPVDHDAAPEPVCSLVAVRGGAVSVAGVWVYTTEIVVPFPSFSSQATAIDSASVAEQLSYAQACQTARTPASTEFINPLPGSVLSSVFGFRLHPIWDIVLLHSGSDIVVLSGTAGLPVSAAAGGTVVAIDQRAAYGSTVVIDHGDRIATIYAHLASVDVSVGQDLLQGETIGSVGSTGFVTGAPLTCRSACGWCAG